MAPMNPKESQPTNRAQAIARGLVRSGRARRAELVGDVIRLERRSGGYYWVAFNGHELGQGMTLGDAEPLQPTFVAKMMAAGRD